MGRDKKDSKAIHRFFLAAINGPDSKALIATVKSALPRTSRAYAGVHFSTEQRDWLKSQITSKYWTAMPKADRDRWYNEEDDPPLPCMTLSPDDGATGACLTS